LYLGNSFRGFANNATKESATFFFTRPSPVEGMLTLDGAVDVLKKLDDIVYAGGPLKKSAGDRLALMTRLSPVCD